MVDFKQKLAMLRAKNAPIESSTTATTTVTQPNNHHPLNAIPVESKEADEIVSDSFVSILDKLPSSSSEGSGNSDTKNSTNDGNGAVSFAHLEFFSKLQSLEEALISSHPAMPGILRDIHQQISKDPELVTVLTDEQIGVIVNGLKKQTNTELSGSVAKQSKAKDKKIKLDVSML